MWPLCVCACREEERGSSHGSPRGPKGGCRPTGAFCVRQSAPRATRQQSARYVHGAGPAGGRASDAGTPAPVLLRHATCGMGQRAVCACACPCAAVPSNMRHGAASRVCVCVPLCCCAMQHAAWGSERGVCACPCAAVPCNMLLCHATCGMGQREMCACVPLCCCAMQHAAQGSERCVRA